MEESEKRKERLKAMRIEAEKSELHCQDSSNPAGHLVNPLAQSNISSPAHESSASFRRFDYYTDPTSAFSGVKKRGNAASVNTPSAYSYSPGAHLSSPFSGPRNPNTIPLLDPANQFQANSSPYQGSYRAQSPIIQSAPQSSPASMSPFSVRSPLGAPSMQNRSPSTSGFGNPPHASRGGFMTPCGLGSPHTISGKNSSQSMNSGRGGHNLQFANSHSSYRFGNSSGRSGFRNSSGHSGWSSGWKKGAREHASALQAPELFFSRIMIQDPWEQLSPIVGCVMVPFMSHKTPGPSSWLPASIATKKAKVDESGGKTFPSRSNLAEYLALSFEEAANDESEM